MANDYISREALIEKLSAIPALNEHPNLQALCFEWAKAIPTADVQEVKHGKWIEDKKEKIIRCSCCGKKANRNYYVNVQEPSIFCPHCGAKMDRKD